MKTILAAIILSLFAFGAHAQEQEKGVDRQNNRIRDEGNDRTPGVNGANTSTGTGRGIDFGKKSPTLPPIANPYRINARRDTVINAVQELMRDRGMTVDSASSKPANGLIISQPYTFVKGAVVALSELSQRTNLGDDDRRSWMRGRYTLVVEAQAVDATTTNVSVNARIEGRAESPTGAEWVSLRSNGATEQDFLGALIEKITGAPAQRGAQ